ncbi:hypothetical protein BST61_g344 [Cercospora zeina]
MVNKILFWSSFGIAVRFWQLGIEMRPFFQRENWLIYPIYGGLGASFGYWLQGVDERQMRYLGDARQRLIEKRKRRAEREGQNLGSDFQKHQAGAHASVEERGAAA